MPEKRYRTHAKRKRFVRTPGGKATVHHERRGSATASCASCGTPLSGVPSGLSVRGVAKSSRRPNRPFGGNLCPSCSRRALKESVRG